MIKRLFYDLETTGINENKHSIHQIAGIIEIDGKIKKKFNLGVRPHPKAEITPEALNVCGVSREQIMAYKDQLAQFRAFKSILKEYVDPYKKDDKFFLIGFNNRSFDDKFLFKWFEINGDNFCPGWFYFGIDTSSLALQYLIERRMGMPSFKLHRVVKP